MKFRAALLIVLLSLALGACYSLAEDVTPPPDYVQPTPVPAMGALYPDTAPDAANGAAIYLDKCAPCHGPTGLADGPQAEMLPVLVPALGSPEVANRAAPAAWYAIVTQGNLTNFMPGFASLTDQERWDVVAYAHSLSVSVEQIETGQAVYEANCAVCHGVDGKQTPASDFTDLQWISAYALDDWAVGVRQGKGLMPGFESQLGDADVYAALAYARTFAYTAPQAIARAQQSDPAPAPVVEAESDSETETAPDAEPVTDDESAPEAATPAEGERDLAALVETDETPASSGGQVSGTITSAAGGTLPSGLRVVLYGFDHGADGRFSETLAIEAEVGSDGRYIFENLEMPEGRAFYVLLDYEGVEYASEAAFVQAGQTSFDLPILIYEAVSDPSLLEIGQAHVLLEFSVLGKVTVIHFLTIDNLSDKTVVPPAPGEPVVTFSLPQGFENLQFEEGVLGGRFLPTQDGFGDQVRVTPGVGEYQLVFAYDLPYTAPTGVVAMFGGDSTELSVPLTLPARAVTVLVPEGIMVEGTGFTDTGLQSMGGGMNFQMYRVGSLAAGQNLDFKISGTPRTTAPVDSTDNSQTLVIGIASLGIVLIAVGGYLYWRDRRTKEYDLEEDEAEDDFDDDDEDDDEPEIEEHEILDAILALDDQFKAGNIAESVYRERRAELKAKLR